MSDPWKALAEPFPDSDIKHRPGRGGMTFAYVDARAVMQRLDDVLTPSGWDFTSTVVPGTDIVRGELTVGGVIRVDYGYPNSDSDEEPIKSASSDALKRCAVMFGIGRHLYSDNTQSGGRGAPPPRPSARPVVVDSRDSHFGLNPDVPEEPADLFPPIGGEAPAVIPTDECPIHGTAWTGKPGDLWHGPKGVVPEGYCRHPDNVKPKTARRAG